MTLRLLTIVIATLGLIACSSGATSRTFEPRWFSRDSPFNTLIRDPEVHPDSEAMVAHLLRDGGAQVKVYEYGYPVVYADESTPRYRLMCTRYGGACPVADVEVPIPEHASPNDGVDAALVVVAGDVSYDLFQLDVAARTVGWASITDLSGTAVGTGGSGSGIARLAGLVTVEEVEDRWIRHALAVSVRESCEDRFVWPATATDGWSDDPGCIPLGTHLQLDPAVDLTAIDLTPLELAVGQAMQRYGAYVVDSGQAALAVNFERPEGARVHEQAGVLWDYMTMEGLPWRSLRVLEPAAP